MKKILIVLLAVFMLTACSSKNSNENVEVDPPKQEEVEVVGGWTINDSLPEMNDARFNDAREDLVGVTYSPLFVLGTQPVAGENIQYLCYAKSVTPDAKTEFKVVTIFEELDDDDDDDKDYEIKCVEDFNVMDYLEDQGSNTPEGLMGGWQDNGELPNMLSDDEKAVFEKALDGLTGVGYTPVAKLASQVVAGTNYAFLAVGTVVAPEQIPHLYVISVYADLQGNAELKNICGIDLSKNIAK